MKLKFFIVFDFSFLEEWGQKQPIGYIPYMLPDRAIIQTLKNQMWKKKPTWFLMAHITNNSSSIIFVKFVAFGRGTL